VGEEDTTDVPTIDQGRNTGSRDLFRTKLAILKRDWVALSSVLVTRLVTIDKYYGSVQEP